MKIASVQQVDNCLDGVNILEYGFNDAWDRENIGLLSTFGRLEYFADFPRPMFRLTAPGIQVKGVQGEKYCRVIYSRELGGPAREKFEKVFS